MINPFRNCGSGAPSGPFLFAKASSRHVVWSLLGIASCAGLQAVEIGINFARDGGGTSLGPTDGCSAWTDVYDGDGFPGTKTLTGSKITAQWHASNTYWAGAGGDADQRIYACYLDDGQSTATSAFGNTGTDGIGVRVRFTGLTRWLELNECLTYQIVAYNSTDTDGATFQPITLRDGGGTSLATFTPQVLGDNDYPTGPNDTNWDPRGKGFSPDTLTADVLNVTVPKRSGSTRGSLAALKIVGVGDGPKVDHFESGDGTVSVVDVELGAGLTSEFRAGLDHPTVTGSFAVAATHHVDVIQPEGGFSEGQTYNLLTLPVGTSVDLNDLDLGDLPRGVIGQLEIDSSGTNPILRLNITEMVPPPPLFWTGAIAGGAWDVDQTGNWSFMGDQSNYWQGDEVVFDDSVTGTTNVDLDVAVLPYGVKVDNDETHPYSITGSGAINGAAALLKTGEGTLTLGTANGYAGTTTINDGTVIIGANAALGSNSGGTTVAAGARLDLNGHNIGNESVTLNGSGPDGAGALVNGSATAEAAATSLVLSGEVTIGGSGDMSLGNITGASASLTKIGAGEFSSSSPFGFTGTFNLDEGVWNVSADASLGSCAESHINDGGTLRWSGDNTLFGGFPGANDKITLHQGGTLNTENGSCHVGPLVLDGGTLSADLIRTDWGNYNLDYPVSTPGNATTSNITGGNVTLSQAGGTLFDIGTGDTLIISSKIDGDTGASDNGLIKNGPGTLELVATNSYNSATTINAGTLLLTGSLRDSSAVTLASGATLSGNGTANGSVTVQAGATVAPGGMDPVGTLKFGSATMAGTFQCQIDETSNDVLEVSGALNLADGTIELTTLNAPTAPVVVIASAASIAGTPTITGTVPAGYTVQTTATEVRLISSTAGFSGWIGGFGLAAGDQDLDDDADADGIDNGIEYVLGGNPASASDVSKLPQGVRSGGNFVFSFDRVVSSDTPDVALAFEHGDNLSSWDTISLEAANPPQVTITRSGDNLTDHIVVTIPASGSKLFGRLKVSNP